ncbi:hypothetical protein EI555_010367, partial [Monodon monoceros]
FSERSEDDPRTREPSPPGEPDEPAELAELKACLGAVAPRVDRDGTLAVFTGCVRVCVSHNRLVHFTLQRKRAKMKNRKGKTISLTDLLAEDGGTAGGSTYVPKPVSWADETDDLEGDVSTTWHSNDDDVHGAPPVDHSIPPTAPRAARESNIHWSCLPKSPPYPAFLGNLPCDMIEDSIKGFFRIPSERLKGFGNAEFEDLDSLLNAPSLSEESLGNRRIRVDVADQAQDKDRMIVLLAEIEIGILTKQIQTGGPVLLQTALMTTHLEEVMIALETSRYRDGYRDSYRDGPRRDTDRYGGRDRYDDQGSGDYDRGYDSRIGSGRRAFGNDRSWSSKDDYSRGDYRRDDRGPPQRPKLNLKPRSTPKEGDSSASTSQSSQAASEQEKLQRQLDEPKLERQPRERHPSWRSEETQERERPRAGNESSQTGTSATSGRSKSDQDAQRRESEKSLEYETPNKEEDCQSPASKPPKPEQPLKVMPTPPPKENACVKRSSNPPDRSQSSDTEQQSRTSGGGKVASAQPSEEGPVRKADENKVDGVSALKSQSGNSSHGPGYGGNKDHWKEADRKDGKKHQDSRSAPEPKKAEENPASKFSSASKYAALGIDGEGENEGEDYTK